MPPTELDGRAAARRTHGPPDRCLLQQLRSAASAFLRRCLHASDEAPSDHRFSATLSSPDLAVIGCIQALAKFSQETGNNVIPCEGTEEKDWRAAGQKVTFRFSTALYRDLFKNEVRRLLPANLVRFVAVSDNDPTSLGPDLPALSIHRNKLALVVLICFSA